MQVGEKIKSYINERGIKQSFLAEKTGKTDSTISKMLNGQQDIDICTFFIICKALDVPMEHFFKEEA